MSVSFRVQNCFRYMLNAPDREAEDRRIAYELQMAKDFIEQMESVKNAPTRTAGDAILRDNLFGKHEKFAIELADIYEAPDRESGNKKIDELIDGMKDYILTLHMILDAKTRDEGNVILRQAIAQA